MTIQVSSSSSQAEHLSHAGADVESALTVARLRSRMFGISTQTTFGPQGRYIIRDRRGTGGMANVYEATDTLLDMTVALKLLRTDPWQSSGRLASAGQRLIDEAKKLAATKSASHVARIYNVDTSDGVHYISMEYIAGPNLRRWQTAAGRTQSEVIDAYLDAGRGLAELHRLGLVHLDFKPENVMIDERVAEARRDRRSWRAVLVDLGLAVRIDGEQAEHTEEPQAGASGDSLGYTLYIVGGTPAYTAPERLLRRSFGRASDQFSFCVALYEALFRSHPLVDMPPLDEYISTQRSDRPQLAESTLRLKYVHDVQQAIRRGRRVAPSRELRLPWGFLRALERGMDPDPAKRFRSMDALIDALTRSSRVRARAVSWVAPIAAGLTLVFGGNYVYQRSIECSGFDERVEAVWNSEVAGRVAARFSGAPIGETVARTFEDFADRWRSDSEGVCRAHLRGQESDPAFDKRQVCMSRALRVADSAVAALTGSAVASVNPVQLAVLGDLLTACGSEAADEPPLPEAEGSAALIARLDELTAMEVLGELPEARERAEALLQEAEELGVPALTAEAAHRLGHILSQMRTDPREGSKFVERAGEVLARSREQAALAHRGGLMLDAWTLDLKLRAETITSRESATSRLPGGEARLADAEAIVEQYGSDAQRAQIREARGLYWHRLDQPQAAIDALESAVTLRRAIFQRSDAGGAHRLAETVALAKSLVNLGSAALQGASTADARARLDQAVACYREAVELWTEAAGRRSLHTLRARMNLALALVRSDEKAADSELDGIQRDLAELALADPEVRARGVPEWTAMHVQLARRAFDRDERSVLDQHLTALRQVPLSDQNNVLTTYLEAELCMRQRDWSCVMDRTNTVIVLGEAIGDAANVAAAKELRAEAVRERGG